MSYEYAWKDPLSGRRWTDGYQPIGVFLVRIRREIGAWEEVDES